MKMNKKKLEDLFSFFYRNLNVSLAYLITSIFAAIILFGLFMMLKIPLLMILLFYVSFSLILISICAVAMKQKRVTIPKESKIKDKDYVEVKKVKQND